MDMHMGMHTVHVHVHGMCTECLVVHVHGMLCACLVVHVRGDGSLGTLVRE